MVIGFRQYQFHTFCSKEFDVLVDGSFGTWKHTKVTTPWFTS